MSESHLLKVYLDAIPQWVRRELGRGDVSGLSKHWKNPRIGVYIDIVTKPATGTSSKIPSGRGLWSRLGGYQRCADKGALNGPIEDKSSAHLNAIMNPINKMDLRIIAVFADDIPVPYVLSLETVMILFFGCCKTSSSSWRSEALIKLVKSVEPDQVNKHCEPLNGTLPSRQTCDRRRARVVDPQCAHCHRTREQRLEDGETKCCNKWLTLDVSQPDMSLLCLRCAEYRYNNKILPPPHVLEKGINMGKSGSQKCDACFRVQPADEAGGPSEVLPGTLSATAKITGVDCVRNAFGTTIR